jgi:hypothetical protein
MLWLCSASRKYKKNKLNEINFQIQEVVKTLCGLCRHRISTKKCILIYVSNSHRHTHTDASSEFKEPLNCFLNINPQYYWLLTKLLYSEKKKSYQVYNVRTENRRDL